MRIDGWKIHTLELSGDTVPIGYKVVDTDLRSTGLSNTPQVQYLEGEWVHYNEYGIWSGRVPSTARWLGKYIREAHSKDTRVFITALDEVIGASKMGVKSNGIMLLEEVIE